MRIGVISDIHGNFEALTEVLQELDNLGVDEIYSLGDVVGYYPQVNEVCNELIQRGIPNLMGNHDWYMASGGYCTRSKSVNECLAYQRKLISQKHLEWLKESAVQRFVGDIHMVHGGWADPIDEYMREPDEEYFSRIEGRRFMSGHTHVQGLYQFGDKVYCNPGSVGQPRDNDPRAAFAVVEDGKIILHRVAYDFEKIFKLMKEAGFSDYFYGCLKTGNRTLCRLE